MEQTARTKLFIDAMPLAAERVSGIGHITYGLVRAMLDDPDFTARYEVTLVAARRGLGYVRRWKLEGSRILGVPVPSRVWNRLPGVPLLPPFDLILGKGIYLFPNYRAWPLLRSKSVTFIHDLCFMLHPDVVAPRNRRFLAGGIRRWVKRSGVIVTAAKSSKAEIHEYLGVPESRIRLVHWGVDAAEFYPRSEDEIAELAQRRGLPKDYILFLGTLEPRKNVARLIAAYRALPVALKRRHPLVLAGGYGGWLARDIEAARDAALKDGDQVIKIMGYLRDEELPVLYSGASILAWPSLYEGFGMPPLQAMACGTPCVLSRSSSLPEVGGRAALYADAASISDISDKMKTLLEDKQLHRRLTELGLKNAGSFSWSSTVRQLREVLDELTA
jgi:glycosyltransferase involved in cell wall biosynthesis